MTDKTNPLQGSPPDLIQSGIVFEEQVISVLINDVEQMRSFVQLDDARKAKIIAILETLRTDSIRHERELRSIADKY